MGFKRKTDNKSGLQFKMSVVVTSAVLLVSTIILLIMAGVIRHKYEKFINERISDDLIAISQNIEQRILRIEDATKTFSGLATPILLNKDRLDTLLVRSVKSMTDILGVSIVSLKESLQDDGILEHYAYYDSEHGIITESCLHDTGIDSNPLWKASFIDGKNGWSGPLKDFKEQEDIICYYVPLYDNGANRVGATYSYFKLSTLTTFVTSYKVRKDIDISVYTANGSMVVAPDDYILKLKPEDMIVRDCNIDHLDWKIVLSADRKIIDKEVGKAMATLALLILLLFFVISMVIRFSVTHVARPFIKKQHQTEKEKAVMDNELKLAARAQNEIVPHVFPPFPNRKEIDVSACLYPARNIGGDLYDYFISDDKLYFCIGDVSGKGLQASLFMASTHYLFRSVATGMTAAEAVRQMNTSLCTDNDMCRFVTFWFGCLDLGNGRIEYVNAGHNAPLLLRDGKTEFTLASDNPPLGVVEEIDFVQKSTILQPADILLLYTDGVTEAMDHELNAFGEARFLEAVGDVNGAQTQDIIEGVLQEIRKYADGAQQSDDITMLCIKYNGNKSK